MAAIEAAEREKPKLRLIELPARPQREIGLDWIAREAHYKRIRYLAGAYRLQWLVEQATFHCCNIEDLSDDELIALHRDLDRARECPEDDVSYQDRGLVRNRA